MTMKCVHLIISGKVQGVFFRANTRQKASDLGLKGYAKNLKDKTVEVVAQGEEKNIDELVIYIKQGPGIAKVNDIKITHKMPKNFKGFEIIH